MVSSSSPPPLPLPAQRLDPLSAAYETTPLVRAGGFREYDARWRLGSEINLMGVQALGLGLGTLLHEMGVPLHVVTGHDFRSYSSSVKYALIVGLMASGVSVHDIGLALSPMAYFAQFALDIPAVAMVTASHNDNGWTGVKMGSQRPVTFGPDEMGALKKLVLEGRYRTAAGGTYRFVETIPALYEEDLVTRFPLTRKLKVVAACGNGTAGAFAPRILERVGCEVIPLDTQLDYNFPRYNPNPEDLKMLHAMAEKVQETGADLALGFDGDGDRCGVVDHRGREIFADKMGVMLARDLSRHHPSPTFVVDVKSTSLFVTDPVLQAQGVKVDYWKTGHSYIKRRVADLKALAGFEKSGHFFFNEPLGRGYDDGLLSALHILRMLDHAPTQSLADLYEALPQTWSSPTMAPHCADEVKYKIVEEVTRLFKAKKERGEAFCGQQIQDLISVNGIRVQVEDGTWGLVRASSNKPELVVVVESPVSSARMKDMFESVDAILRHYPEVGAYNQTLKI